MAIMMRYSLKEIVYFFTKRLPVIIYGRFVTKNLVKVHWGKGLSNFGDCLQPDILKHYGLLPVYVPSLYKSDIILEGSILQLVPLDYSGYILGTGGDKQTYSFENATIIGVRGKLTMANFTPPINSSIILADTGLLVSKIFPNELEKIYDLGVVFHFVDEDTSLAQMYKEKFRNENILFINVRQKPKKVINQIKSCKAIVSTSLHGLIVADAFHIPNKWIINRQTMPTYFFEYKFYDYYSSLGIEQTPYEVNGNETAIQLISSVSVKPFQIIEELISSLDVEMTKIARLFKR